MNADEPPVRVVAAVVFRGAQVLMTLRPPGARHAGLWEFPGGKIEPGETAELALVREVEEELGVVATPLERLGETRYAYPGGPDVEITFVRCVLASFEFRTSPAIHAIRWTAPAEVVFDEVLAGDHQFLIELASRAEE